MVAEWLSSTVLMANGAFGPGIVKGGKMKQLLVNIPEDMDSLEVLALLTELIDRGYPGYEPLIGLDFFEVENAKEATANSPLKDEVYIGEVFSYHLLGGLEFSYVLCCSIDEQRVTSYTKEAVKNRNLYNERECVYKGKVTKMVDGYEASSIDIE
jgi:hypothetical protein